MKLTARLSALAVSKIKANQQNRPWVCAETVLVSLSVIVVYSYRYLLAQTCSSPDEGGNSVLEEQKKL